jgi:hypothetical protein
MPLSDLLLYIALFLVSFALGCAHGAKCDIADRREAMKRAAFRRAA